MVSFADDGDGTGKWPVDDPTDDPTGAAGAEPMRVVHQYLVRISPRGVKSWTPYYTVAANPDDAIHSLRNDCYFPEVGDIVRRVVRMGSTTRGSQL